MIVIQGSGSEMENWGDKRADRAMKGDINTERERVAREVSDEDAGTQKCRGQGCKGNVHVAEKLLTNGKTLSALRWHSPQ